MKYSLINSIAFNNINYMQQGFSIIELPVDLKCLRDCILMVEIYKHKVILLTWQCFCSFSTSSNFNLFDYNILDVLLKLSNDLFFTYSFHINTRDE